LAAGLVAGAALLRQRSLDIAPIAAQLRAREAEGALWLGVDRLVGSYLHMHANRMLRAAHRAQEAVIYHFLERLYESQVARQKSGKRPAASASGGEKQAQAEA
jgi:hypothetical protein